MLGTNVKLLTASTTHQAISHWRPSFPHQHACSYLEHTGTIHQNCAPKENEPYHWPWLSGVTRLQPPFLDSAVKNQVTILPSRNTQYPAFILVGWLCNIKDLDSLWLRGLFPWPHCYQFHSFLNCNYPNPLINMTIHVINWSYEHAQCKIHLKDAQAQREDIATPL